MTYPPMALNTVTRNLNEPVYWGSLEYFDWVICVTCRYCLIGFSLLFAYFNICIVNFVCVYSNL